MFKIDLHTHSIASPDGGLTVSDYQQMLETGSLDSIAVTDHDSIAFATDLQKQLGNRIIIGEEISTKKGEIIGLFLKQLVPAGLPPAETIRHIHRQGGLVYIPHPFETVRKGLKPYTLDSLADKVDIVEIHNGRAYFQDMSKSARRWADSHNIPGVASSDAHGRIGWGRTATIISSLPTRDNIVALLKKSDYSLNKVGIRGICYPKLNRFRKIFTHAK